MKYQYYFIKSLSVMHVGDWFIRFGKLYLMQRFANECFTLETCNFVDILVL